MINGGWIDTHCHLDAAEFDVDRDDVARAARAAGVTSLVVPAVCAEHFGRVAALAARLPGTVYTLGIHPLYVAAAAPTDLDRLRDAVAAAIDDPRFVGIGEIGLDHFVPDFDAALQQRYLDAQLRLAKDFDLPVLLHCRRALDPLLKALRRFRVRGIVHAFNGSFQQAWGMIELGCKLGFGGVATHPRALQIRRLAAELPLDAIVVETDAPDLSPHWRIGQRNAPDQLPAIAAEIAQLRGVSVETLRRQTTANSRAILPRLAAGASGG